MVQRVVMALIVGVVLAGTTGCRKEQAASGGAAMGAAVGTAAGVTWSVPARWKPLEQRPMRVATYSIPAAQGDSEPAECAVFYFGSEQGGSVDANIDRWHNQFSDATPADRSTSEVEGMDVTTVTISGTYLAPSGPMMTPTGSKEHYRLLGAIVHAPQGFVFFKLTGPERTAEASRAELNALVGSLKKEG